MPRDGRLTRRSFLKTSLAAAAGVTILPRRVLGGPGYLPPSDEVTRAVIGVGGMGLDHLTYEGARLLAVCDVDAGHLSAALNVSGPGVRGYRDFRDVLARPD
ncbi:MAG: twin-arginine translocation signal domain-containing protein, partial [Candidatus Aminicenantales bacterium]